jgi:hypothetical protein
MLYYLHEYPVSSPCKQALNAKLARQTQCNTPISPVTLGEGAISCPDPLVLSLHFVASFSRS